MNQNQKKKLSKVLVVLSILLIPLIICLLSFKSATFDLEFYNEEFEQYNPDVDNALGVAKDLTSYLKYTSAGTSYLVSFNEEEITHLKDVKSLVQASLWILYISVVLLVVFAILIYNLNKENKLELFKKTGVVLVGGGVLNLVLIGIFRIFMMDFQGTFTKFHHVFFPQGGWQFPVEYNLVKLFPAKFFIDAVNLIAYRIIITAVFVLVVGIIILIIQNKIKKKLRR
ncbi:TIGR01906 family membrane protein [Candidatus Woesearchaeota archaeon]|nr:TIGR01906 family membrane protein [Candidatus Woesearchaeota archaeon]